MIHKSSFLYISYKHSKQKLFFCLVAMWTICGYSQEGAEATLLSDQYIYEGNTIVEESFVEAEKNYRMALSEMPSNRKGAYNLGNAIILLSFMTKLWRDLTRSQRTGLNQKNTAPTITLEML